MGGLHDNEVNDLSCGFTKAMKPEVKNHKPSHIFHHRVYIALFCIVEKSNSKHHRRGRNFLV